MLVQACDDRAQEDFVKPTSPRFDNVEVRYIVRDAESIAKKMMSLLQEDPDSCNVDMTIRDQPQPSRAQFARHAGHQPVVRQPERKKIAILRATLRCVIRPERPDIEKPLRQVACCATKCSNRRTSLVFLCCQRYASGT